MSTKLEVLRFLRNNLDTEYTVKELCKEFDITQPAMWKNIRELWWDKWIIKSDTFPTRYKFNELFLVITKNE